VEKIDKEWHEKSKLCFDVQRNTLHRSLYLIGKYLNKYNTKNIVISGGYGLNCVSNHEYLKKLDANIFIDPTCDDCGISIGAGLYHYYEKTGDYKNIPLNNVYFGYEEDDYNLDGLNSKEVSEDFVVELLREQNIIALFQGKSEIGARALGNRSIIFDPRNPYGKDIMNNLKKRESFRPFGATILEDKSKEWFDMINLESSPFMLYAVKCHDNKMDKIPAVLHVDGTSRIQTLTKKQNPNFYSLIEKFYKKTNVPMLLNTSFNLNGEPIVETFEDSLKTFFNSKIDFLYLPEIKRIILK